MAGPVTGGKKDEAYKERPTVPRLVPVPAENSPEEQNKVEEKAVPPKTEVLLDAADGSGVQIALMQFQTNVVQTQKAQVEVQLCEANVVTAKERLQSQQRALQESQNKVKELLAKHDIPEGWDWRRNEDGTYRFYQPVKPPIARPPR